MGHSATHRQLHGYFNEGQLDRIGDHLAVEFMFEDLPQGVTIKSQDEFVDYLASWRSAFSDAVIGDAQYADGPDHSVATFHARGHHDGELAGFPPTGRHIDVPFCEVMHYTADGHVLAGQLYYDMATMLGQLGATAGPGEATDEDRTVESPTELVHRLITAIDRMDFDMLEASMADDVQAIDEISRGWMRGRAAMLDYFKQLEGSVSDVRSEIRDVQESVTGDTGTVTFVLDQGYTHEGSPVRLSAPTTMAMRREPDGWKVTLVHSVPLPEG